MGSGQVVIIATVVTRKEVVQYRARIIIRMFLVACRGMLFSVSVRPGCRQTTRRGVLAFYIDLLGVLPSSDQTGIAPISRARSGAPIVALPVSSTLEVVRSSRQRQRLGRVVVTVSGRRTGGDRVSNDPRVDGGVLGQSLSVGSLPSFGIGSKCVSTGKVVLEVVGFVLFLPLGETSEIPGRGLSSGPKIEDQTQDVESQPESQTPFDTGGAASDVVASGSIGIALTSTVESGERDGGSNGSGSDKDLDEGAPPQVLPIRVILLQGEDFSRLEDCRDGHTDDEDDGHRPVNGRVVESVEHTEHDQGDTTDRPEKDGKPVQDPFPLPHILGQSVHVTQPALGPEGEHVKDGGEDGDADEEGVVGGTDIRYKDHGGLVPPVLGLPLTGPQPD